MAFPKLDKASMDVPTGPTDHLQSSPAPTRVGGDDASPKSAGKLQSPFKPALGQKFTGSGR